MRSKSKCYKKSYKKSYKKHCRRFGTRGHSKRIDPRFVAYEQHKKEKEQEQNLLEKLKKMFSKSKYTRPIKSLPIKKRY
jgi:hypothetical protein